MKAFQKQEEAHLEQAITGLDVRALPAIVSPGNWISAMAVCPAATRATVTIMFVVFGLLTSGA